MTMLQTPPEQAPRAEPYANDGLRLRLSGQVLQERSIEHQLRSIMAERETQAAGAGGKHARRAEGKHARRGRGRSAR
jgi:hypothetical protein